MAHIKSVFWPAVKKQLFIKKIYGLGGKKL